MVDVEQSTVCIYSFHVPIKSVHINRGSILLGVMLQMINKGYEVTSGAKYEARAAVFRGVLDVPLVYSAWSKG